MYWNKHFVTRWKSCFAYRPAFCTPNCSRSYKGLAPREIISREIWERFQLIDVSTVWQPKSNYLKRAESGRKRVVEEMITGSLPLPFSLFRPVNFSLAFYFRVFPLSESLEQANVEGKSEPFIRCISLCQAPCLVLKTRWVKVKRDSSTRLKHCLPTSVSSPDWIPLGRKIQKHVHASVADGELAVDRQEGE